MRLLIRSLQRLLILGLGILTVWLIVFVIFAWAVLGETLRWNYAVSLLFLGFAVFFAFGFNQAAPPAA